MSNYTTFIDDVLEVIKAAVPTVSFGIREEQMRRRNWRNEVGSGEISLPFIIFSCSRLTRTDVVPSGNAFLVPLTINLVDGVGDTQDATGDRMETLIAIWQALLTADLTLQEEESVTIDTSSLAPTIATTIEASAALSGGSLSCNFVIDLTT